jgi:hypothetical protein
VTGGCRKAVKLIWRPRPAAESGGVCRHRAFRPKRRNSAPLFRYPAHLQLVGIATTAAMSASKMVIKYFGPNDKRGVYWSPYTAKERQASMYRNHGGPMVIVRPAPRSPADAAAEPTNHQTEATSRSAEAGASTDPPPGPPPGTASR